MNVLIYDHSVVPDIGYQQRIRQLFACIADITIRFVNGILDATWHARHFRPDVIVFDWICDCKQLRKLARMLHGIKPDVAMFHLDGERFVVTANLCGITPAPAVPHWLHNMASHWILAQHDPVPVLSS